MLEYSSIDTPLRYNRASLPTIFAKIVSVGTQNVMKLCNLHCTFPGMESMEFLPDHNAIKLFGTADLDHVYKRDGLLESFRDEPLSVSSENGSVVFNLQTR